MARVLESKLILSLVDRVTAPARNVQTQMDRLNARVKAANEQASRIGSKLAVASAQMAGFALAVAQPIGAAMDLEDKMADIGKVSSMNAEELKAFEGSLRNLARSEIPMAVEELAELASSAAASGIADNDLEAFTRQVAKSAVAWGVSGEYAGESLAKIKAALGMTIEETARYADAINYLDDTSSSKAGDLIEFSRRVAADGKIAGFTNEQVLALGSSMISMGAQSDVAATSLRNAQKALTRGPSATKRQDAAFRKLGLHADDVAKAMPTDALGQFLDVLGRINKLPQHERISTMSDLFGDEARALMPLLGQLDEVRKTTGAVADEMNYLGSVQKEFAVRSKTGRYALQRFKNQLRDVGISIGQSLLPGLKEILERLSPILLAVGNWTEKNGLLVAKIISVTGALIGMRVALLALRFAGLTGKSGALSLLAMGMNTVGRAGIAMGGAVRESIRLQAALAAMDGAKIGFFTRLGAALRGLAAVTGLRAVGTAIGAVAGAVGAISAPVWLAIAAAVAAVGLAWKYWDRISSIVLGVADAIGTALRPAIEGLRAWMEPAAPVLNALGDAFSFVWNKVKGLVDYVKRLAGGMFTREILTDGEQAELRGRAAQVTADIIAYFIALPGKLLTIGGEMIQKLWDGMKAKWDEFKGWLSSIPDQISGAMSGAVLSPNASAATSMAQGIMDAPGLAVGGRMTAGVPTMVGERGPEMVYPSRSGWVAHANKVKNLSRLASQAAGASAAAAHSADMTRRARLAPAQTITQVAKTPVPRPSSVTRPQALPDQPARQPASRPISVTFGNIVVQGGANASARDISREIGRTVQAELRGTFTDPY